jgi:hypothetical protein
MKILSILVLTIFTTTAFARNDNTNNIDTASGANSSQGQQIDSHDSSQVTGSDLSRAVGTAIAPALTTTLTETCMGSTSAAVGWSGAGISFGTTWRDSACVRRLDAREIKTLQVPMAQFAAKELMCDSQQVRDAFLRAGAPCKEDGAIYANGGQLSPVAPVKTIKEPDYKDLDKKRSEILDRAFEAQMRK